MNECTECIGKHRICAELRNIESATYRKTEISRRAQIYSCRQNNDYLKYVNYGIAEGDFIGYADNPEKSSGLFDVHGLLNKEQLKNLRAMLRATDSNIWHAVISFTEQLFLNGYTKSVERVLRNRTKTVTQFRTTLPPKTRLFLKKTEMDVLVIRIFVKPRIPNYITDANFDIKRSRRILTDSAQDTLFHLHGWNDYERELKKNCLHCIALYRQTGESVTEVRIWTRSVRRLLKL